MKSRIATKRSFYRPTLVAAAMVLAFAAATSQAQEYIIGEQVVSDTVLDTGTSYVGDMTASDAGCASGNCGGASVGGAGIGRTYGQPDLFYNYYTQGNHNTSNAQMYMSPLPVPPNVGHTFNTYQPFYPEEYLYAHKNTFHKYYDNGRGMNRTKALYYSPPIRQAASNIYWNYLRIPR